MKPSWTVVARAALERLFRQADAARWGLSLDEFADAVDASVRRAFADSDAGPKELERYLGSLHAADLALAWACVLGRESAWDHFVREHRPVLYRAADALDPSGGARELADSLYADLYGLRETGSGRRSLFRYFHGRSSLATWLRAVLAQRLVDAVRSSRRLDPLPDGDRTMPAVQSLAADPDRPAFMNLVVTALQVVIQQLPARDRLRLRSYYVLELTLAEIGRMTGEHEATVSRHLARTRRTVRQGTERYLREEAHLSADQIGRALELAMEDPGGLDLQQVFDLTSDRKEPAEDRSR